MKPKIILLITAALVVATLIFGYFQMTKERAADEQADQPISAASRAQHSAGGKAEVSLDQATQELIGLQTAPLTPASLPPERRSYGRVLDSPPLIAQLSAIESARASLEASSKEYQRVKTLYDQGENASAQSLETADAAIKRDRIALQSAQAELVAAWGESVAQLPNLGPLVESLATLKTVLVRLDLPAGEVIRDLPIGARLLVARPGPSSEGTFLGRAPFTDPQAQGNGFMFLVTNTPPQLAPGLALTGFLLLPGEPLQGVIVPEAAVVRADDQAWSYVQSGSTNFMRRSLSQEHPVPGGWFMTHGFEPGERIVTTGAQTLLSEERKSEIKVED